MTMSVVEGFCSLILCVQKGSSSFLSVQLGAVHDRMLGSFLSEGLEVCSRDSRQCVQGLSWMMMGVLLINNMGRMKCLGGCNQRVSMCRM